MFYVIINRACPAMQQELPSAVQGRDDVRVILDRRYGDRRVESQSRKPERRRQSRRHSKSLSSVS